MNTHLVFFIARIFIGKHIKNMLSADIMFYGELYSAHGNGQSNDETLPDYCRSNTGIETTLFSCWKLREFSGMSLKLITYAHCTFFSPATTPSLWLNNLLMLFSILASEKLAKAGT